MVIRQATQFEAPTITQLVQTAFQTAQVSDDKEQTFVLHLRDSDVYLPELELVAEKDGQLIGHIMLTKQLIQTKSGKWQEHILVAPLCVELEHRNQGIGEKLLKVGLEKAKLMGYTAAFLVGNPDYYCRFGFRQTTKFGIHNTNGIPDQFVLGIELVPNALSCQEGTICFSE